MSTTDEARLDIDTSTPVWRVTIVHPGRQGALTATMYDQLEAMARSTQRIAELHAVVLSGTPGSFCSGTDVRGFADFSDGGADGLAYERRLEEVFAALDAVPVPVIGVVDGAAMGGGLALLTCCDLIVASERARFGAPFARTLGNCVPASVLIRLERLVGAARMRAILLLAEQWSAEQAVDAGFVHKAVPVLDLPSVVEAVLDALAAGAPLTLRAIKELDRRLAAGRDDDQDILLRCYGSRDFREGVRAFHEKRRPEWMGR